MLFSLKGTTVRLNTVYYCPSAPRPINYQPNGWDILRDLGVDVVRIGGGSEGDVGHFNIPTYPNEWAQNLDALLSQAQSHNMRVYFNILGSKWGTLFGAVCPQPVIGVAGTPLADAKLIVDQLVGNNPIGHNFIIDSRIYAWSVANEVDLADPVTYDWCIGLLDYIRFKGGKAGINSPYYNGQMELHLLEPILRGHVDYFQVHLYGMPPIAKAQREGGDVYAVTYTTFHDYLSTYVSERGTMPLENIILGEFGIWHDYGIFGGAYATFTPENVRKYYDAVYLVCNELGIRNVINFECFAQRKSDGTYVDAAKFWCVDTDGTYVTSKTDAMKANYLTPTTSLLPVAFGLIALIAFIWVITR